MYRSDNQAKNQITGINRYNTFGLREKDNSLWVSTLVEMRENFFPYNDGHPLGRKMVEAASAWFQQAELVDSQKRKPTALVDLFAKFGGNNNLGWEFVWMALANNAILIKWLITTADIGRMYSIETLTDMLILDYPNLTVSAIRGGFQALKEIVTKSPLGGEGAMVAYEMKGRSVISLTRLAKEVHPLAILYGLYLMARLSDTSTFTVNGILDADIGSTYISPIVAFGIPVADFKRFCEGLRSRYPEYIATTFTHGNDEVRVFPDRFTTNDIIQLTIREV